MSDEVKPKVDPAEASAETITIKVVESGVDTFFKVKMHTQMGKIFDAYAARKGVVPSSLRFFFDGQRLVPENTPQQLEMEDGDQVDCMIEAIGGSC